MMADGERARRLAQTILTAAQEGGCGRAMVSKQGGCAACDPGSCAHCGHLFTGEVIRVDHPVLGRRNITDRAVHALEHGITCYQTGYVVRGVLVEVVLDLNVLERYFDLT